MTNNNRVSMYDKLASTLAGQLSLAAADAALTVTDLLHAAKGGAGLTNRDIASRMNVTDGRVSQILNGDGNLHVATIVRFLGACGYDVSIDAIPQNGSGSRELPRRRRRRKRRPGAQVWQVESTFATLTGVTKTRHYIESFGDIPIAMGSAVIEATYSPSGYSTGSASSWSDQARAALRNEGTHSKALA